MPVSQTRFNIEAAIGLPIMWGVVALLLAIIIPPAHLEYQISPMYLDNNATTGRSALILTAHPDDEAMFFSPTIRGLVKAGWDVRGLCLSNGNAEGKGSVREQELRRSYEALGVGEDKVTVLNEPTLQDGMDTYWATSEIASVVDSYLSSHPVEAIVTFDTHGISSHPNHIALSTYRPPVPTSGLPIKLYHIRTPWNIITKYTGPFNPLGRRIYYQFEKGIGEWMDVFDVPHGVEYDLSLTSTGLDWIRSVRAMLQHKSQMVWYRYGWLAAGGLMWSNDLKLVDDSLNVGQTPSIGKQEL